MELDLATRTLFADFKESVFARTALEKQLKGAPTFVRKTVKGKVYWYEQAYASGRAKQTYFGPSNDENDKAVAEQKTSLRSDKSLLKKLLEQESRLSAMLGRGGFPVIDRRMSTLLSKFSDAGLIDLQGILVGTLAYRAYSGILGTLFEKSALMTQDIDIARDDRVEIAGPILDIKKLFSQPGMSCRAIPTLSHKSLSSSFITSDGIRIDFLVPLRGREKANMRMPHVAGAGALALRFLDFLIREPVRTVLVAPSGGIGVTVPSPERYAIHKLIIVNYRPVTESEKREKDLRQAESLINFLSQERPRELKRIKKEACSSGKRWEGAILKSIKLLSAPVREFFE